MSWVARRRMSFCGLRYEVGDVVPEERLTVGTKRALVGTGRIAWEDDPPSPPAPAPAPKKSAPKEKRYKVEEELAEVKETIAEVEDE